MLKSNKRNNTNTKKTTDKKQLIYFNEGGGRIANFFSTCLGSSCGNNTDGVVAPKPTSKRSGRVAPLPPAAVEEKVKKEEVKEEEKEGPYLLSDVVEFDGIKEDKISQIKEKYAKYNLKFINKNANDETDPFENYTVEMIELYSSNNISLGFINPNDINAIEALSEIDKDENFSDYEKEIIRRFLINQIRDVTKKKIDPDELSKSQISTIEILINIYLIIQKYLNIEENEELINSIIKYYTDFYGFSINEAYLSTGKSIIRLLQILFGINVNTKRLIANTTINNSTIREKVINEDFFTESQKSLFKAVLINKLKELGLTQEDLSQEDLSLEDLRKLYVYRIQPATGGYKNKKKTTNKKIVKKLRRY
jgi:hypothetical protein